ncbi:MAG: hypothetical protein CMJ77_22655 [Planctomycetaceae bacterium]|nr:hypothetical protein [Planctomycetaceae bacterium]
MDCIRSVFQEDTGCNAINSPSNLMDLRLANARPAEAKPRHSIAAKTVWYQPLLELLASGGARAKCSETRGSASLRGWRSFNSEQLLVRVSSMRKSV